MKGAFEGPTNLEAFEGPTKQDSGLMVAKGGGTTCLTPLDKGMSKEEGSHGMLKKNCKSRNLTLHSTEGQRSI